MFNHTKLNKEKTLILLLTIITFTLNFLFIGKEGYGNPYYAAAVKSMGENSHNFFFVSFDSGGFVSVDKPPLGLWIQTMSAMIFGFNGWSLILPQALAGALSVPVLYSIVTISFNRTAGFLSVIVFIFTPIFIATSRTNNLDSLLVFIVLLASWSFLISIKDKNIIWLIISMALLGTGFNIKMLQAYMVLPAMFLTYYLFYPVERKKKITHLAIGTVVLAISSLWWAVLVDLKPTDQRPYVGSSKNNSVIELALSYNGISRILPGMGPSGKMGPPPGMPFPSLENKSKNMLPPPGGPFDTGFPGILRLFNKPLAGQTGWFLITSIFCLIYMYKNKKELIQTSDMKFIQVFYWALCLMGMIIYFSISTFFHKYYLIMMAPVIASITGIGISYIINDIKEQNNLRNYYLLLIITALTQFIIISRYPAWAIFIIPATISMLILSILIINYKKQNIILSYYSITIGILSLMIGPVSWTLTPVLYKGDVRLPYAGPELAENNLNLPGNSFFENNGNKKMIDFLKKYKNTEEFLIAVPDANIASPIILSSNEPVMAYGGFIGNDRGLSVKKLIHLKETGKLRFIMICDMGKMKKGKKKLFPPMMMGKNAQADIVKWVLKNGKEIPEKEWKEVISSSNNEKQNFPGGPPDIPLKIFDLKSDKDFLGER